MHIGNYYLANWKSTVKIYISYQYAINISAELELIFSIPRAGITEPARYIWASSND